MFQRILTAAVVAVATFPFAAGAALADTPDNDAVSAAHIVESPLPWTWTQDTSQATTEPVDERVLLEGCGLSISVNGSVWFRYTDVGGAGFAVDVKDSNFLASVAVVQGDPATGPVVACGEGRVAAAGVAGETFWIMAYSDRPSVNGGQLQLSVEPLRAAPTAMLTMDPDPTAYADGSVVVSGTYSCENADAQLSGKVSQGPVAHERANHFFLPGLSCDGATHRWEAVATSYSGRPVAAGRARATAPFMACGDLQCVASDVEQVVQVWRSVSR
jgi:hypothetical protein